MPRFTIGSHSVIVVETSLRQTKNGKRHVRLIFENDRKARIHRDCWLTEKAINTTLTILCDGFGLPEPDAKDFPSKLPDIVGRKCRITIDEEVDNFGQPALVVRWVDVEGSPTQSGAAVSADEWTSGTAKVMGELRAAMERRAKESQATSEDEDYTEQVQP